MSIKNKQVKKTVKSKKITSTYSNSIPEELVFEYNDLVEDVLTWDYEYYNENSSSVSDAVYDKACYRIRQLEDNYPQLVVPYSPTQRVGGVVSDEFEKVSHISPMLSLDKRNSFDDLYSDFVKKNNSLIIAEHKIDGLTLVLEWNNGMFISATTRGNGVIGEMVLHTAKTIKNLPIRIPYKKRLIVRGECFIRTDDFDKINKEIVADGGKPYSTARNLASGSLRQKDPKVAASRGLLFQAYEIIDCEGKKFDNDIECLSFMSDNMIPVVSFQVVKPNKVSVKDYISRNTKLRKNDKIPYKIDGLVFKIDDLKLRKKLGVGTKYPNWAIAYKFEDDVFETTLLDIEVSVSRTRRLNPVAIIDTVMIDGTAVSRATLNNFDFIEELYLGIGDKIVVKKANEIIPNIVENITCSNSYIVPDKCPACGAGVVKKGAYLYCVNKNCIGAKILAFKHFASRNAMDIRGLSYSRLYDLIDNGFVKEFYDLYNIKRYKKQIINLEGWGEKSYIKIYNAIDKSRSTTMERFLFALGIPMLGYQSCCSLCEFVDWDITKICDLSEFDLLDIPDFGEITARSVARSFRSNKISNIISRFMADELIEFDNEVEQESDIFEGYVFVITGTLSQPREVFENMIISNGGLVKSSLTKDVTHLLAGDKAGSKLDKAKQNDVKVIDERQFNKMLED